MSLTGKKVMEFVKSTVGEDLQLLVEFFKENLRSNYSSSIYNWQYGNDKSNLYFAIEQNSIKGCQGMIYYPLRYNKSKLISFKSESTFVDVSVRGQGVFEKLYHHSISDAFAKDGVLIWGFTALGKVWEKKLSFECDNIVKQSIIVLSSNYVNNFKRPFFYLLSGLIKLKSQFSGKYNYVITNDLKSFDEFEVDFYTQFIAIDYSSDEWKNRIENSPFLNYFHMQLFDENLQVASIIFTISNNELIISDLKFTIESKLTKVVNSIIAYGTREKCAKIIFWGNYKCAVYNDFFNAMKCYYSREVMINDMQLVTKSKLPELDIEKFAINSLWTEGFKM